MGAKHVNPTRMEPVSYTHLDVYKRQIIFILVFLIGHSLNLAINALGAYVHTNRLQYVEFFGKFYEGGGRKFEPFAVHTKYYKVKEDI